MLRQQFASRSLLIRGLGLTIAGSCLLVLTVGFQAEVPTAPFVAVKVSPAALPCRQFGAGVCAQLQAQEGNLVFSPLSAWSSLAMAYAGARGSTAEAMAGALSIAAGPGDAHEQFGKLLSDLRAAASAEGCELRIANAAWLQQGIVPKADFIRTLTEAYGAEIAHADFVRSPEDASAQVNRWVSLKTNGKLGGVLEPGDLNEWTRLVLANAIYFKGQWASRFPIGETRPETFHVSEARRVQVQMMHQTGAFLYAESEGMQALVVPYKGNRLAMVVVLPSQAEVGRHVEHQELGVPDAEKWLEKLRLHEVDVSFPRFSIRARMDLEPVLRSLGMGVAFDSRRADFSGIAGAPGDLFVQKVVQGALIEVDEEGTTAAAATAVGIGCSASAPLPPATFTADRPFRCAIIDIVSGLSLFEGRLSDPRSQ